MAVFIGILFLAYIVAQVALLVVVTGLLFGLAYLLMEAVSWLKIKL